MARAVAARARPRPRPRPAAARARAIPARAVSARAGLDARTALLLLGALTAARLAAAAFVPLAPDEAYYWTWSHALAPGYLDAPPMVALWIRAGTALLGQTELGVRLLGPVSALIGSLLLWDAGERLLPGRGAGAWAAVLLNATLLFGAGAVLMTPDTPLLFFWTACLWALARFLAARRGGWLLAAGLFAGLAFDSKYTAALLGPAVLLWLLLAPELRGWLVRPVAWLSALAAVAATAPVLAWNAANGWASFAKQGGRIADFRPDDALRFLGELALGQAGLATPLIFALCLAGGVLALRLGLRRREAGWTLLALLIWIPALVFIEHAFGDRVQANWPAVIYPAGAVAAAGVQGRLWERLRAPAAALGLAVTALAYVQAAVAPFPLPAGLDPIARQLDGWDRLAAQAETARRASAATFVAADDYAAAAELAWWLPPSVPVVATGPRWALVALPRPDLAGESGLLVSSESRPGGPWASAHRVGTAARRRAGQEVKGPEIKAYPLYEVTGKAGGHAAAALLPRR